MEDIYHTGLYEYQNLTQAFLDQEALMLYCRANARPVLHAWQHARGFLAGAKDTTLAGFAMLADRFQHSGYHVLVRPFGGLAVPVDDGVINLTLIIPGAPPLDEAFSRLADWIKVALLPLGNVAIGEVQGSYCPGRFDLSMGGKKFSGLAQRRIKGVVAVSAFVNLFSPAEDRALLIAKFYHAGENGAALPAWVPQIDPLAVSDLFQLTRDEKCLNPRSFLQRIYLAQHTKSLTADLSSLLESYLPEAAHRMQGQRGLKEWLP